MDMMIMSQKLMKNSLLTPHGRPSVAYVGTAPATPGLLNIFSTQKVSKRLDAVSTIAIYKYCSIAIYFGRCIKFFLMSCSTLLNLD